MNGLDYLGADPTLRTMPRRTIFGAPVTENALVSASENVAAIENPRRAVMLRRAANGVMGVIIGAAYGSIFAGASLPLCALAGAVIGGALPLNDPQPLDVTRLPYRRQPWSEREAQRPVVAMVRREPEEMPSTAPATVDGDRFGRLEID